MKLAFVIIVAALAMTALVTLEVSRHGDGLPPRSYVYPHEIDEMLRKERLIAVKGTGSMAPYIPAGDPTKRVAWVRVEACDFSELKRGDLVVFETQQQGLILHQLSQKTAVGWITSGLNNHSYDSTRVYPENFQARVVHTYVLK